MLVGSKKFCDTLFDADAASKALELYCIKTRNCATFYAKASTETIICTNKIKTRQLTFKMEGNRLMQLGQKEWEEIVITTTTLTDADQLKFLFMNATV